MQCPHGWLARAALPLHSIAQRSTSRTPTNRPYRPCTNRERAPTPPLCAQAQDPTASAVFALSCLRDLLASDDTRSHKGAQAETQEQRAPFPASLPYLILDAVSVDPFSISDPTASTDTSQTDEDSSYPATTESSDLVGSTDEAPFAPNLAAAGPGSNATGAAAGALALDAQAVDQAVQLLYEQLQQGNVKMGLRIAAAFRLGEAQVQGRPEVLQGLRESFEAQLQGLELPAGRPQAGGKGALTLAVGLLMQFPVSKPHLTQDTHTHMHARTHAGLRSIVPHTQSRLCDRCVPQLVCACVLVQHVDRCLRRPRWCAHCLAS